MAGQRREAMACLSFCMALCAVCHSVLLYILQSVTTLIILWWPSSGLDCGCLLFSRMMSGRQRVDTSM